MLVPSAARSQGQGVGRDANCKLVVVSWVCTTDIASSFCSIDERSGNDCRGRGVICAVAVCEMNCGVDGFE